MINTEELNYQVPETIELITYWHYDRNLIKGTNDLAQLKKLREEVNELFYSIGKKQNPIDDIGDIIVVLINIAERNELSIWQCLSHAYNDIKDRTGRIDDVTGMYVKDK